MFSHAGHPSPTPALPFESGTPPASRDDWCDSAKRCSAWRRFRPFAPRRWREVFPMMFIPKIHVCGVPELKAALRRPFTHVISIWDPEWIERGGVEDQLRKRLPYHTRLHVAYFHDTSSEEPGRRAPVEEDLRQILGFAADLKPEASVLIHCWAGISRSTAVAFAILCQSTGPGHETDCLESVLAVRPQAFPNALIVALADRILERQGAMQRACDEMIEKYATHGTDSENAVRARSEGTERPPLRQSCRESRSRRGLSKPRRLAFSLCFTDLEKQAA